eukprot:TRINITY_DN1679_c0_g1_i10.p1 TRINITY_DN1679_c0_g1~~TRINITY_DN1679_c0_g1_i10.p1  ORF type:complete len:162 (+),score=62.67 TRINITY_DN1679_c0_g1_i10:48-533(+)
MAEKPEDLNLPTSIVTKIIKDCLPGNCKVSKEANAAIAKAASVFVLYTTSSANAVAQKSNRKTISGQDVISAMTDMEFDKFVKPLENSLALWKKSQQEKKNTAAKKKAEKEAAANKDSSDSAAVAGSSADSSKDAAPTAAEDDEVMVVDSEKEKESSKKES